MGPLSIQTSTAKAAFPTLRDGLTSKFRLQQVSWSDPEGDRAYGMYKFEFHTTVPADTRDNEIVQPGFPVTVNVNMGTKETPNEVPKMAITNICTILDALLGTADQPNNKNKPARPDFDPQGNPSLIPSLIGKEIIATVKLTASKQNPDQLFCNLVKLTYPGDVVA